MEKVTLVLGASSNPERFAYKAIISLQRRKIPVIAIGRRETAVGNLKIRKGMPDDVVHVHTIAMYMNENFQQEYHNYILSLKPKRIIFNPGTSNCTLAILAQEEGIEVIEDCMLVMLGSGRF